MDTLDSIKTPEPVGRYRLAFKLAAALAPALVAAAGWFFGDVQPVVHDLCSALLPTGTVLPLGFH